MTRNLGSLCAALLGTALPLLSTSAQELVSKEELAARYPEVEAGDITDGPIAGIYEVAVNGTIAYVTTDGRFLLQGDIIDLGSRQNLTEARRAANRADLLARVDERSEIVFSPKEGPVKHHVFVFTDVDCGYCRQFHREIADVTALGIEVHYLAYPRTGPDTESWTRAQGVWCSADRHAALTEAKLGAEVAAATECATEEVKKHYDLGHAVGVTGTPAIYSATGVELGGYLPPADLLMRLELLAVTSSANP